MIETTDAAASLPEISQFVADEFRSHRAVLTYQDWYAQMLARPARNLRGAAQYLRDVFLHFGTETVARPGQDYCRYRLFDAPWAGGEGLVAGQEAIQGEIFRHIQNFVRDGSVSRLLLLHGPNGSAKSSIVQCIQAAMEHYSNTEDGALYTYSWIFPSSKITKSSLGFGGDSAPTPDAVSSYANLPADQIDARLPCQLRDHPIFLIPRGFRENLLAQLKDSRRLPEDFVVSRYIREGDLSPRDRAIYDALLIAYEGDHDRVLRHIQIERFYISRNYARGTATIEPQMHVDAVARQMTADNSLANLPRALQTVPIHELHGPLVAANRGLLEFSDLLKRPLESFKYLLSTSEKATASLPEFRLQLDQVLVASSNELQLAAFKEHPDWHSFKGRLELVTVPYVLRWAEECSIYKRVLALNHTEKPQAPHLAETIAMWAVLTRLRCPRVEHYPEKVREVVRKLKPIEKLWLYDRGAIPDWCTAEQARELENNIHVMWNEYRDQSDYEGQLGASAREMRTALLNAAQNAKYRSLTPIAIFDELEELIKDKSLYLFLRQEPRGGYHDHAEFISVCRRWWTDTLDTEIRTSMGLIEEGRHMELFSRYVMHVSQLLKKERVFDEVTGAYVPPDEAMMVQVETNFLSPNENREDFRRALISKIGAWGLDHPAQSPNYRELFGTYIDRMEARFFESQARQIARNLQDALRMLEGDVRTLSDEAKATAKRTIDTMTERFHYPKLCTEECIGYLLRTKYASVATPS